MLKTSNHKKPLGILAGNGYLPMLIAKSLERRGVNYRLFATNSQHESLRKLKPISFDITQPSRLIEKLQKINIRDVIFAGSFDRSLVQEKNGSKPDAEFARIIRESYGQGDDGLLRRVAKFFEEKKIQVLSLGDAAQDIMEVNEKFISKARPTQEDYNDIKLAMKIFRDFSKLDLGQSIIVAKGLCMGIETNTGTDNMITGYINYLSNKPKNLMKLGGILLKGTKTKQDKRFDLPTIGPKTLELVYKAGIRGLVVESGNVIFIDKEEVVKLANSLNLFIWSRNIND